MKVWWREEELLYEEQWLLGLLFQAHHDSCFRSNPSSVAVINSAAGSGDISKAIAAAILTIGGQHAPLEQTYHFLEQDAPENQVVWFLAAKQKVPGWGGSFQKDGIDPLWKPVNFALYKYQSVSKKLDDVTAVLHREGKIIYPNPSALTAAVAIALGIPAQLLSYLFIKARLDAWAEIAWKQETNGQSNTS